jgi:hypothetical protein
MLFDQATPEQIQAGRILTGVTMAGFLGARIFGRHAQRVRLGIVAFYIAGFAAFALYSVL